MERYEPAAFESKWQKKWVDAQLFRTREDPDRPKFYGLDFFPYPSGAGLSVGHCRNYIPTDVLCRMKFMQGYNVLHPMGFDAFGLPAENEAIRNQSHPEPMVKRYGDNYRRQLELIGNAYDWDRCFYSSDPSYYRWTQWIFTKLFEKGLAYRKLAKVNWCPKDKTVLADEEVEGGLCWRCGTKVERKDIPQWFFKITDYAERLLTGLDSLDWPEGIKKLQQNWIGKSEGVQFRMKVAVSPRDAGDEDGFEILNKRAEIAIEVFTTRIDTLFGATFVVLAPEHPLLGVILRHADPQNAEATLSYVEASKAMSDTMRQSADREKTGVFTGIHAINPANGSHIPIYVADYVLMGYGTGAIMAVPAHDERDFEFAVKYGLPVVPVIEPTQEFLVGRTLQDYLSNPIEFDPVFTSKSANLMNSGDFTGMSVEAAQAAMGEWVESCEIGHRTVNFRLRDWLISRQRYWGCPIPIIHEKDGVIHAVSSQDLPVYLPDVDSYEPTEDGESPLANITDFVNVTTPDGTLGRRETDTMGGFACSSWYFLRFADPDNHDEPWNRARADYWMPVDVYVGGAEHAVMHLLYARFWMKVFYDLGLVAQDEPFARLQNQGQVLAMTPYRQPREDESLQPGEEGILIGFEEAETLPENELIWRWARMSKSKGNVVTPDEAVERYGADALRIYELFVAPFDADVQWSDEGMAGAVRFLSRIFRLISEIKPFYDPEWKNTLVGDSGAAKEIRKWTHQTIEKCSADIERFAFNTYVSSLMIYSNNLGDVLKNPDKLTEQDKLALSEAAETLVLVIAPSAPHSADELWSYLGHEGFTYHATWPVANPELSAESAVTIAVQVNGKLRDTLELAVDLPEDQVRAAAMASPRVQTYTEGKEIVKVIVIPNKLVSVVVR